MKNLLCLFIGVFIFAGCVKNRPVEVLGITLNKESVTLLVGDTEILVATIEEGEVPNVKEQWSSDNEEVARVYGGVVKAVSAGIANITARAGNKTATCVVTVPTIIGSGIEGDLTWTLTSNGILTISGNGDMLDFASSRNPKGAPWEIYSEKINELIIAYGVTGIGDRAFINCPLLEKVTLPNSITSIGDNAFMHCHSLTNITFPNSLTTIGSGAFTYCNELTNVTIPNNVRLILSVAFTQCARLESIDVESDNPYLSSEDGVLFEKDKTKLLQYPYGKSDVYAIPDGVIRIEEMSFLRNDKLKEITIPNSVTRIGNFAFQDCPELRTVMIMATTPPEITSTSNFTAADDDTLYVPAGCVDVYKADTIWNKAFTNIVEQP